jgi:hypothetical protein
MNHVTGLVQLELGQLDTAEQLVASSVRTWGEDQRRDAVQASTMLAEIHVRAGEPDGPRLAEQAIRDVSELRSVRARVKLAPLADALQARPAGRELARHARRVAAVPA